MKHLPGNPTVYSYHSNTFKLVISRYTGWKSMLDAEILREPSVKFYLNQALDMMNRAVAGTFQPGARENMAYFISTEKRFVYDPLCG